MGEEGKIPLPGSLQEIVGALLFASETPLTAADLRAAIRAVEPEQGENDEIMNVYKTCTAREVDQALKGLAKSLDVAGAGFSLVCAGGAYRLQTVPSCGRYVRAMLKLDRPSRLGRASLETLAIIAYRQPITKSEVEEIRGVDVSGNMKTLMDLQLVRMVGKSELPGHPFLYGTTPIFLEHFGLASLQQLNELDPTLQRSNPREKAASYRKPVQQETLPLEGVEQEKDA
ncbi:MAG: SMC-Scp complex subunit ScpB, partial [Kiritimatiellae bacterium]|nr:SMC-Scp complex subunit ScpB [Kiritimatiellia bacterium]